MGGEAVNTKAMSCDHKFASEPSRCIRCEKEETDIFRAAIRLEMLREAKERVSDMCTESCHAYDGDYERVTREFDRMIAEEEAKS